MLRDLVSRILGSSAAKAAEGSYRPGPYHLPITGGILSAEAGQFWNWWQLGYDVQPGGKSAVVEACISAYSQTIAMCPGTHWRLLDNGGRERVTTSALSRILREPNSYQSPPDFTLNLVDSLYREGNAYALALRNSRFEIDSLHLMNPRSSAPRVAANGELFYSLAGNPIIDAMLDQLGGIDEPLAAVPARDVLHVRLKTRGNGDLRGESPIVAAAMDEAASSAMAQQAIRFFLNSSRPSGVLVSPDRLTEEEMNKLRERWNERSKGLNVGGVPILSHGLKWEAMSGTSKDAQLAEIMGYTDKRIAAVYRVPLAILNLGDQGPQGSTETLMQFWIGTGLGFALNQVEEAIGKTFGLFGLPNEYLEFDTAALLRSSFKDRVDAFARGVQGGIYSPNEARNEFELPDAEDGDEPRVQQQVVPLSFGAEAQPTAPGAQPPAAPPAEPDGGDQADQGDSQDGNAGRDLADLVTAAIERYESIRP